MARVHSSIDGAIYARLLRAYPEPFRHRFGHPMLQAYADRRRDAAADGFGPLARFLAGAFWDAVRSAAAERRRERQRDRTRRAAMWAMLGQDLRQGVRNVIRQPGLTLTVVVTLALGIGANATVFSAVAGLLGPLPFPDAGRLVHVWQADPARGQARLPVTPAAAAEWEARGDLFAAVGAYLYTTANLTDALPAERVPIARVSGGFFAALGVAPAWGRVLTPDDAVPDADAVVVVSDAFRRRRLEDREDLTGATVRLGETTYRVVGWMPASFEHLSWRGADLWVPATLDPEDASSASLRVVARLASGVSRAEAQQALGARAGERAAETGGGWPSGVTIEPLHQSIVGETATTMIFIQLVAAVVLLVACANLANLLLARSSARRREFAIRASLGAGRWRLVRQALTESLVLAAVGGLAGLGVAAWGVGLIVAWAPADMPRLDRIRLDGVVLAASLGLATLTGLVVGTLPAVRLARSGVDAAGAAAGRSVTPSRQRPLRWLIVGEIALAVVVVGVAGLLGRALAQMQDVDAGLDMEHVVAAEVSLPFSMYETDEERRLMFDRMVERVAALPGVERAGVVDALPLTQSWSQTRYRTEEGAQAEPHLALAYKAHPGYFDVVGIPVIAGRGFAPVEPDGAPVLLVSESLARRHWPAGGAVGRRIWFEQAPAPFTIVGVVGDVRHTSLGPGPEPGLYFASSQLPLFRGVLVARTSGDPRALVAPMRSAIADLDPMLPLFNTRTTADLRDEVLSAPRLIASLTGLFAALALMLGVVGVAGIVAFSVASRRRETGVRLALGARPGQVARMFLWQGLRLAAIGLALGLAGATAAGIAIARTSPEIPPPDAATLAAVAGVLGLSALLACLVPARRALRVDPVEIMRAD